MTAPDAIVLSVAAAEFVIAGWALCGWGRSATRTRSLLAEQEKRHASEIKLLRGMRDNAHSEKCRVALRLASVRTDLGIALATLGRLREHCFITNELGHRVRFHKASSQCQAKAEGRAS